jgi:mono/diheme cytochrome c family protein
MKKMKVLILGIVTVAAASVSFESCSLRKAEPLTGRPFTAADASVANGERVYMAYCQKCHPGGEGGLGPAINPNPAPGFVKRFQVRHGLGVMPAFKRNEITKSDLHDISAYLRKWKHY